MTTLEVLRLFNERNLVIFQGIIGGYIKHDKVEVDQENGLHKLIVKGYDDREYVVAWIITNPEDQEEIKLVETLTENFSLTQLESEGMRRILDFNHELKEELSSIFVKSLMS